MFVVLLAFIGDLVEAAEAGDFIPGPADYYGIVAVVLVLFGAIMAPELLGPDRRDNVLPLYLVRPLTTLDYLGMRLTALAAIVLVLVYSGQALLMAGLMLTAEAPLDYLRDNWEDIPRILLMGAVITLFISLATLAVSAPLRHPPGLCRGGHHRHLHHGQHGVIRRSHLRGELC